MNRVVSCRAGVLAVLLVSWEIHAEAAPCGRPDVDLTFPPDGAKSVPTNAILTGHYSNPALYDDERVTVTDSSGNDVAVSTSFDKAETLLRAVPDAPLVDGFYTAKWPPLRGATSGVGLGKEVKFFVQDLTDSTPPTFAGLTDIDWDLSRDHDPCIDGLEDRFVFKLKVGAATDDAGVSLLMLSLFQTRDPRAPEQSGPSKLALRAWPESGELEVRRPADKAGDTCFAAIAQDLVGSVSGGGEREVCIKTKKPPFFDGCSIGARSSSSPLSALLFLAALGSRWTRRGRASGVVSKRAR